MQALFNLIVHGDSLIKLKKSIVICTINVNANNVIFIYAYGINMNDISIDEVMTGMFIVSVT